MAGLRVRHLVKEGHYYFMIFNEVNTLVTTTCTLPIAGPMLIYDSWRNQATAWPADGVLTLAGHEFAVVIVADRFAPS